VLDRASKQVATWKFLGQVVELPLDAVRKSDGDRLTSWYSQTMEAPIPFGRLWYEHPYQ
jgi:hypothetical protein